MTLVYTNSFFGIWLFFFDLRIISEIVSNPQYRKDEKGLVYVGG